MRTPAEPVRCRVMNRAGRFRSHLFPAGACLTISLSPAMAGAAPPDATELDPLVVSATREPEDALRVPAAIDVISAGDIGRA
ncbi:MAG TPA: hypothetical protein VF267_01380, partial [Gammaproteobacteria bacterium]